MTHPLLLITMVIGGFFLGALLSHILGILSGKKVEGLGGVNLVQLIFETFYMTCLFSVPFSGNIPLFIITTGLFLYSLYGAFGGEQVKGMKPEDKVFTKWFSGYP